MGAKNDTSKNGSVEFFKLKEDKADGSKTKNQFRFYKQTKEGDSWKDGETFNVMEGHLTGIKPSSYEWQGKQKETIEFELTDSDGIKSYITMGLDTNVAKQILNTLAGEDSLGELRFECGSPKEFNKTMYPTLYIKNNGQKTSWKFSKEKGNDQLIPKITNATDEDQNKIRKGVKANLDFWKNVIEEIKVQHGLNKTDAAADNSTDNKNSAQADSDTPPDDDGLPF